MVRVTASEMTDRSQRQKTFAERDEDKGPVTGQYWERFRVFYMTFRVLGNMPYTWREDRQVGVGVPVGNGGCCVPSGDSASGGGDPQQQPSFLVHLPERHRLLRPPVPQQYCRPLPRLLVADVQDYRVRQHLAVLHDLSGQIKHFYSDWAYNLALGVDNMTIVQVDMCGVGFGSTLVTSMAFKPSTAVCSLVSSILVVPPMVLLDHMFLQPQFEPWYLPPLILARFYTLLVTVFWVANCVFIIQIVRNLKKCFFQMLSTSHHPEVVKSYRLLWLGLRHRIADLGKSFSGILTLLLVTCLVSFVFGTYNMLSVLAEGHYQRMKEFLIPWMWSWLIISAVFYTSHQVYLECESYFVTNILETKLQSLQPSVIDQIEVFLDTIDKNPSDLVLADCIVLSRSSLLRAVSVIIFYLVVLLVQRQTYKRKCGAEGGCSLLLVNETKF